MGKHDEVPRLLGSCGTWGHQSWSATCSAIFSTDSHKCMRGSALRLPMAAERMAAMLSRSFSTVSSRVFATSGGASARRAWEAGSGSQVRFPLVLVLVPYAITMTALLCRGHI